MHDRTMPRHSLEPIRQAVSSGELARAHTLWNEAATELAGEFANVSASEARLAEVRELVEWTRAVVMCERAHLLAELKGLEAGLRVMTGYELGHVLEDGPGFDLDRPSARRIVAASF